MKDEAELLANVRRGALEDFAEIIQRHQRLVVSILCRYERDFHRVEDLAQETFVKAWRALDQFNGRAPFAHWLSRIAVRVALDHLRRQRRTRQEIAWTDLGDSALEWLQSENPSRSPGAEEAREILELGLRQLSAPERLVITLQEMEGRSVKEISQLTGWSGVTVRVRAYRARTKLARSLTRLRKGER